MECEPALHAGRQDQKESSTAVVTDATPRPRSSILRYFVNVYFNGFNISAVIDTGSGIPHLACTGATTAPNPTRWDGTPITQLPTFEPTNGTPPFTLVSPSSSDCQQFCSQSYYRTCSNQPLAATDPISGACDYYYQYGTGSLSARAYSGTMSFPGPVTLPSGAQNMSNFLVGEIIVIIDISSRSHPTLTLSTTQAVPTRA